MKRCLSLLLALLTVPALAIRANDPCREDVGGGPYFKLELEASDVTAASEAWKPSHARLVHAGVIRRSVSREVPIPVLLHGQALTLPEFERFWGGLRSQGPTHAYLQILMHVADAIEEAHGDLVAGYWLAETIGRPPVTLLTAQTGGVIPLEALLTPSLISPWEFRDQAILAEAMGMNDILDFAYYAPAYSALRILDEQLGRSSFAEYYGSYVANVLPRSHPGAFQMIPLRPPRPFPARVGPTGIPTPLLSTVDMQLFGTAVVRPPPGILARADSELVFRYLGQHAFHATITLDGMLLAGGLALKPEAIERLRGLLKAFVDMTPEIAEECRDMGLMP